MRLIPLDKLQASTPTERKHGVIVVRQRQDGSYRVVIGKRCLRLLQELHGCGLIPADIPVQRFVLDEDGDR
jgi:hypothetical protein